jgi:formylglycine-generating enzyme required for sulfatase activity
MSGRGDQAKPISLFYSYSHKDEDLRLKLETHLSALRRGGLIAEWHDRKLEPGDAWQGEIDRHLTSAEIVLLLVSSDFIASDYCWGEEMTKALARHERGEARVIPVILRHCRWQSTPLARLQVVPKDAKPIASWLDQDEAFDDVVASIGRSVQGTRQRAEKAPAANSHPEPVAPRPKEASDRPAALFAPNDTNAFLSQSVDMNSLKAYTKWKYPSLPLNQKIHELLISDLTHSRFVTLRDVDRTIEAATDAVECYQKEHPEVFKAGTDFITKSLGFVDRKFRARHPFSERTREGFLKYEHLIRVDNGGETAQDQKMIDKPSEEALAEHVPGREPKPGVSFRGHPIIVAAIIGAIGTVAAAISPWLLEQIQRQPAEGRGSSEAAITPASGPSDSWRDDCKQCPWMISLPSGRFTMGSPESEEGRDDNEGPQHEVALQPFAIGQYEVTFDEWDACVADGGCSQKPEDEGWGRGNRPVINVSWNHAQEYVAWLKEKTRKPYRLPSEAEWEYAARAGTTTPFWTGATINTDQANYDGRDVYGSGRKGEYRQQTTPVDTFEANPWGLHDMHGNVWEWSEDCWNASYDGAPSNGSAWLEGDCSLRVVRGGSWVYLPRVLRSADRNRFVPGVRVNYLGFRVSRTLTP